jgi:hypothetical protein
MSVGEAPIPPNGKSPFKGVTDGGSDMYWYVGCHSVSAGSGSDASASLADTTETESLWDQAIPTARATVATGHKRFRPSKNTIIFYTGAHKILNLHIAKPPTLWKIPAICAKLAIFR